jgi:hypothetical protein
LELTGFFVPSQVFAECEEMDLHSSEHPSSNSSGEPEASCQREVGSTPVLFRDASLALEFACWVVTGLAPLLRLINGAAVTDDQFAFQVALTSVASIGAITLRIYNHRTLRRIQRRALSRMQGKARQRIGAAGVRLAVVVTVT